MGFLDMILQIIPWEWVWDNVSEHLGYVKDLNHNVHTLMTQTNELKRKHDECEEDVKAAESVGRKRLRCVDDWMNDVNKVLPEVESIKAEFEAGRINPYWLLKLGKRVVEKKRVVQRLNDKGVFEEIAEVPHKSLMQKMQVPIQVQRQNTSQKTLEKIEQALSDEEVGILCVYGMGGVGKTTLLKNIYNRFIETQDFHIVIWVTVSTDLNVQAIQQKIANQLGMEFDKRDGIEEKRNKLYGWLRNLRYMLILDDLWEAFSLDQVGIPKPGKQNRCKMVITSRSIAVSNAMEADREIKVPGLSEEEAWDLLCSKTGNVVLRPEIQPIAEEVLKKCGGLPLAISTVGGAMRLKDRKELWQNALRALRRAAAPDVRGMEQQVFVHLKFSYDYLEDPKIQACFLYCSLYPEDWSIDVNDLVRNWIYEGFIDNVDSLEESFYKGYDFVDRLKDACLLETATKYEVKMHDLLRDLAIWITSPSSPSIQSLKFLVKSGKGLVLPLKEKEWEGVGRISIMGNCITELQIQPNCPELVTLLLGKSRSLYTIHSCFFQLLPQLRVLDLSYTFIRSLPPSLSHLVNLRALLLTKCERLGEMPPLGELKELQILDLSCTGIKELPRGFSNLAKLKQLDLSYTRALNRIPCNLISVLTCLEHLGLQGVFEGMQVGTWREVMALPHLSYLDIGILDLNGFTAYDISLLQSLSNLKRFRAFLGVYYEMQKLWDFMSAENELFIYYYNTLPGGIEELIRHVEDLKLEFCDAPISLSWVIRNCRALKRIRVELWKEVECIIDWRMAKDIKALDCLEELYLHCLDKLENIFDGGPPLPSTRFQRLRQVTIINCPKLRWVFSSSMVGHLHQLRELIVCGCGDMEEIIHGDILPDNALQRLSFLDLTGLPKLISICRQLPVLNYLEKIKVFYCPGLKKLPPLLADIQKLEGEIRGERAWWEGIEWEDEHSESIYTALYIDDLEGAIARDDDNLSKSMYATVDSKIMGEVESSEGNRGINDFFCRGILKIEPGEERMS